MSGETRYRSTAKRDTDIKVYQNNLWLALQDIFIDMVAGANINPKLARTYVLRQVKQDLDLLIRDVKYADTHGGELPRR